MQQVKRQERKEVTSGFEVWRPCGLVRSLVSLNGFGGDVKLEVLHLPAGVTSQTATKLTVPRRGVVSAPFRLQASGDAALGDATVTVRATSGSLVHTLYLPISVADQLPSC